MNIIGTEQVKNMIEERVKPLETRIKQQEKQIFHLSSLLLGYIYNPKKVKVTRTVNDRGVLLTVDLDPEDIGSIVGRQGRNINAIRHLVRTLGLKSKSYVSVKLIQPEDKK